MEIFKRIIWILGLILVLFCGYTLAQEDQDNCRDHPMFTRMTGFYIEHCEQTRFDAVNFRDEDGNRIKIEGRVTHIDYAIKKGFIPPSGLEVIRNYENAVKKIGGMKIFEEDKYSMWLKVDTDEKLFWIYIDSWHGGGKGETYGLTIVENKPMKQEIVANAKSYMNSIQTTGHAAIYGIYFDFDKAEIRPESTLALKEIAKLLLNNSDLKIYVVGHTDNVGAIDYNMKLSKDRANAVVTELVTTYQISAERLKAFGVGSLAPAASNKSDDGRAKNRRVELVEQ